MFESQLAALRNRRGTEVMARDYEADTRHAATVEKVRASFEGREAIYLEKGAIRVRVSNIRSADLGTILADIEEIPTAGFPIWIRGSGPRPFSHPLRWTIATSVIRHFSADSWSSPPYVGWTLYFSPKLIEAIVDLVIRFPENQPPYLGYAKIHTYIDNHLLDCVQALIYRGKQ
jgi:hypothetical protein